MSYSNFDFFRLTADASRNGEGGENIIRRFPYDLKHDFAAGSKSLLC